MCVYKVQVNNRINVISEKYRGGEIPASGGEISTIWGENQSTFGGE